ncbi:MAG: hypothetical protein WC558_16055, partial [Patulibacter sp.]
LTKNAAVYREAAASATKEDLPSCLALAVSAMHVMASRPPSTHDEAPEVRQGESNSRLLFTT